MQRTADCCLRTSFERYANIISRLARSLILGLVKPPGVSTRRDLPKKANLASAKRGAASQMVVLSREHDDCPGS